MAAITQPVDIKFDRTRKFRLDINEIIELEERIGGLGALTARMSFKVLRTVLYLGMRADDKGLTELKVGVLIGKFLRDGGTIEDLGGHVTEALVRAGVLTRVDEGKDGEGKDGEGEDGESSPGKTQPGA